MAITPSYPHASDAHLARVQVNGTTYFLKDDDLRSIVEAFGTAVYKNSTETMTSSGAALPTEKAIADYVASAIGGLGTPIKLREESSRAAVIDPKHGDFVVEGDGKEYLYLGVEGEGGYWREVGDETIYALKDTEIAGLTLSSDITSAALSSALGLEALAFKSQATDTLTNYVTGIEGANYTPEGSITVTLDQTETAASLSASDYTPGGTVDVKLSQTATNASISSASYTPEGTVTVTTNTTTFKEVASVGKLPSVDEAKSAFATAGVTANIDSTDTEMLILSTAATASALTATNFNAGELPSLKSENTTIVTGISSASFTGSEVANMKITNVSYDKATLSSASFTGTTVASAIVTGVTYDKAEVVASQTKFTGSSSTITPTLTSANKTVTVS